MQVGGLNDALGALRVSARNRKFHAFKAQIIKLVAELRYTQNSVKAFRELAGSMHDLTLFLGDMVEIFSSISHFHSTPDAQSALVQLSALPELVYEMYRVTEGKTELHLEIVHLKIVKALLSIEQFSIAREHACSILHRMNISRFYRNICGQPFSNMDGCVDARFSKVALGCWLSIFASVSDLECDDEPFESISFFLIDSLCEVQYWIGRNGHVKRNNSIIFRYTLRLLQKIVRGQVVQSTGTMQDHDSRIRLLAEFTLNACAESDSSEQLPGLLRNLAQSLSYEHFTGLLKVNKNHLDKFSAETWFDTFEKLCAYGIQHRKHPEMIGILSFLSDMLALKSEEKLAVHIVSLQLFASCQAYSDIDRNMFSLDVVRHLVHDVYPSHCRTRFWKCVGDLAGEIRSCAGLMLPSDIPISEMSRTIETLMSNISFLLETFKDKLTHNMDVVPYANTYDGHSMQSMRSAIVSLSIAFVSLWKMSDRTSDKYSRQNMVHVIHTCFNCVEESDMLQIEEYLYHEGQKAAAAVQIELANVLFDVDRDLCLMLASSSAHAAHIDRLSIRLMTYTNLNLQQGTKSIEILRNIVKEVSRHERNPSIRGVYVFELIRYACSMTEQERQGICMLQLFLDTADQLENFDWVSALRDYYSAWITCVHVKTCTEEQLVIESCACSMLFKDAEVLTSSDTELFDERVVHVLFDFLLSLMRSQSMRVGSCAQQPCTPQEIVTHQAILNLIYKRKLAKCQAQQLLYASKETEAGAYTLHSLCRTLTSPAERERFKRSCIDLVTKIDDGLLLLRRMSAQNFSHSQMFDDVRRHFMKSYVILETIHSRLCLLDQVTLAEVVSRAVNSITGFSLASISAAFDTFLIAQPSYVPSFNAFADYYAETLWECQRSELEKTIVKALVRTCTLRSQGKLIEAMSVLQNATELLSDALKLAHSAMELWNCVPENSSHTRAMHTGYLRYAGSTILYQADLWKLITLHLQCIFLKSLLSLSLGFTELSRREMMNSIRLCAVLNLRNIETVIQVQYNFFFASCSLNLSQTSVPAVAGAVEALEVDDSEQASLLQEAVGVAVKYATLADDGEMPSIAERLVAHGSEMCLSLLQKLKKIKSLDSSLLADWCYRLIARDLARRVRCVDVIDAKQLMSHSWNWLQRAHKQSMSDTAFVLLAETMVNLQELRSIKLNLSEHRPKQYAMVYESISRSAEVILRLQSQSPAFVKRVAQIRATLAKIDEPLASSKLTLQTQVACSTAFSFRFSASISSQLAITRSEKNTEGSDLKSQLLITSTGTQKVLHDMNMGWESSDCQLSSGCLSYPLVTISESCLHDFAHLSDERKCMLVTRSSVLQDEMPVTITLQSAITSGKRTVSTFVEELRNILASKPQLMKLGCELGRVDKLAWWEHRILQEKKMKSLMASVQYDLLGCWWFLLLGEPQEDIVRASREAASEILSRLVQIALEWGHEVVHFAAHILRLLLQGCEQMSSHEIEAVIWFVLKTPDSTAADEKSKDHIHETVLRRAIRGLAAECKQCSEHLFASSKTSDDCSTSNAFKRSRGAVFLLFDDELNELPWESIPPLEEQQFYRIPCVAYANNCAIGSHATSPPTEASIDLSKAYAVVNPTGDLVNTERVLLPEIKKMGWPVVSGSPPVDMHEALVSNDICLYFGHGTAREYLPLTFAPFSWKAVMVLMGCSSGVVTSQSDVGLDGVILSYLLAGSPAVLANLWDVTDKDIDRFALGLLGDWWTFKESDVDVPSLSASVVNARANCRLRFLTGASPVIYGAPVFMCKTHSCKDA